MAVELTWTSKAEEDLLEIYSFIGLDSPEAAERTFAKLQARVEALGSDSFENESLPGSGRLPAPRSAQAGDSPIHPNFGGRAIPRLYETDDGPVDAVEIVRVVDGRRNLRNLF